MFKMFLKTVALASVTGLAVADPIPIVPDRVRLGPQASTCTPQAGGSSSVDDVPAIQAAITACPSDTIAITGDQTYHINSQLSFVGCSGCTFELNGELLASTDFGYCHGA